MDDLDDEKEDEDDSELGGEFICPECGGTEPGLVEFIEPSGVTSNPWGKVYEIQTCSTCQFRIPAHLAERWEGISEEEARAEWRRDFRRDSRRWL